MAPALQVVGTQKAVNQNSLSCLAVYPLLLHGFFRCFERMEKWVELMKNEQRRRSFKSSKREAFDGDHSMDSILFQSVF